MMESKTDDIQPVIDVDRSYDTEVVSKVVQDEIDKVSALISKPGTKTTSFYVTVATFIAGSVATWLVSQGVLTPANHDMATTIIEGVILLVMGSAITTFLKSRGEVAKIKAQAAATKELGALGIPSPFDNK